MLDILFVTYHSEKWIRPCLQSIAQSDFDLKQVSLYFVDNCSGDSTVQVLRSEKEKYKDVFAGFEIRVSDKNLGFGRGNNAAAGMGRGEYVFCLNIDTTIYPDTLRQVMEEIDASPQQVGMWELRQFPYEHPKIYDPVTGFTSWSSGACFVMRRSLFEAIGGFDAHIFMYGEDVDISWRVRAQGYQIRYIPKAVVNHYCYESAGEVKPTQYIYSTINNLLLRCKFCSLRQIVGGHLRLLRVLARPQPFDQARMKLIKAYFSSIPSFAAARRWRWRNRKRILAQKFKMYGWDYECIREGAFYQNQRPEGSKKVSVILRTCGRPAVLRETLISLRAQTYPNVEIVIVEDGPQVSKEMIESEFSDLNIVYQATGEKQGRCVNGNIAMRLATGDYLNFLDDDDLFYADHIETLVMELERHPEYKIAYSLAFDTPIHVKSRDPYQYEITGYKETVKAEFNRLELLHHNLFPIQAVMFDRRVFEEMGGLDETLDVLEDWNLWVRYATKYPYLFVNKTTSIYRVPADNAVSEQRQKELDDALQHVRKKHAAYEFSFSGDELINAYQAGLEKNAFVYVVKRGLLYRCARWGYRRVKRVLGGLKE